MRNARLAKNVGQLEIRPEAAAEILECAADLGGKVLHEFAASSRPFDDTEYQARSGVPKVTPSVSALS